MANKIKNRARAKMENSISMFDVVVMAVVSQTPDLHRVQEEIAEGLGLALEENSVQIRAEKLYSRLKDAKSFLIILDDVWEEIDLEKLGIPSKSSNERHKIILTSRDRDVLALKEDAKILTMDVLPIEEAWNLFREKAGYSVDAPDLHETARQVAKQCQGLPLALVVVGSVLRNKGKQSWEDALRQLQRLNIPSTIPDVLQKLYVPLKWSYDQLQSEEARYVFLLCCLFPEDYAIPLETLVRYGWGLRIFSGTENLKEARDRVYRLVEMLKCRFLLLDDGYGHVKMHDVIRDMAISIASENRYAFMVNDDRNEWPRKDSYENYTHISVELEENFDPPESINCPRLEFLRVYLMEAKMPSNFFDCMRELKVLAVYDGFEGSLPSSMCHLGNLRALHLEWCELEMVSLVGQLVNLEILSLLGSNFKELPKEVGQLKKLKLLDLTNCREVRKIAPGVISKLVELQELLMLGCLFGDWETKEDGKEMRNVILDEVASLSHLVTLEIKIKNPKLISLDRPNWPKLETYNLQIGDRRNIGTSNCKKIVCFDCNEVIPLGNFFSHMIRNAEFLDIKGKCCTKIVKELAVEGFRKVKYLKLGDFNNAEYLVDAIHSGPPNGVFFAALESLSICDSQSLNEICSCPPPIGSFGSLKNLHLRNLPALKHALPLSTFQSLSQLDVLRIENCPVMEEVFGEEGEVEIRSNNKIKFPKLGSLMLQGLPSMEAFCKSIEEVEFPALHTLEICELPKMTSFCSTECNLYQQFLFSKQKSSEEIHVDNSCFRLFARDLSIAGGEDERYWGTCLIPDSSDTFVLVAELLKICWLEVNGKFRITANLSPGDVYEILYMIMLHKDSYGWEVPVNFKFTLPEGITHHRKENLNDKPRGEWLEILVGEFRVEPIQIGELLEFALYEHVGSAWKRGLFIKGVIIRPKSI